MSIPLKDRGRSFHLFLSRAGVPVPVVLHEHADLPCQASARAASRLYTAFSARGRRFNVIALSGPGRPWEDGRPRSFGGGRDRVTHPMPRFAKGSDGAKLFPTPR
jgi:hypothetical protein